MLSSVEVVSIVVLCCCLNGRILAAFPGEKKVMAEGRQTVMRKMIWKVALEAVFEEKWAWKPFCLSRSPSLSMEEIFEGNCRSGSGIWRERLGDLGRSWRNSELGWKKKRVGWRVIFWSNSRKIWCLGDLVSLRPHCLDLELIWVLVIICALIIPDWRGLHQGWSRAKISWLREAWFCPS